MKRFAFLRKKHIVLGRKGENFAADYLERNGFTILARNWRTEAGELDIVARKEHEIHFVEVKTLHHKEGFTPAGNLSFKQRRRNFSAGKVFLALLGSPFMTGFFDLIEVEYTQRGAFLSLKVWNDYLPSIVRQKKESEKVNVPEVPVSDGWLARFLRYLNFLPCPLCGTGNGGGTGLLCDDCKSELKFFHRERSCPGCGGNLDGVTALCSQCLANGELPLWDRVFSVFEHTGSGRKLILDLKYNKRSELAFLKDFSDEQLLKIHNAISLRLKHVPLAYIFGKTNFFGYDLKVSKDVLIPRLDTEILLERVCKDIKQMQRDVSVLDIGTGSGAIAIVIKKETNAKENINKHKVISIFFIC